MKPVLEKSGVIQHRVTIESHNVKRRKVFELSNEKFALPTTHQFQK